MSKERKEDEKRSESLPIMTQGNPKKNEEKNNDKDPLMASVPKEAGFFSVPPVSNNFIYSSSAPHYGFMFPFEEDFESSDHSEKAPTESSSIDENDEDDLIHNSGTKTGSLPVVIPNHDLNLESSDDEKLDPCRSFGIDFYV